MKTHNPNNHIVVGAPRYTDSHRAARVARWAIFPAQSGNPGSSSVVVRRDASPGGPGATAAPAQAAEHGSANLSGMTDQRVLDIRVARLGLDFPPNLPT